MLYLYDVLFLKTLSPCSGKLTYTNSWCRDKLITVMPPGVVQLFTITAFRSRQIYFVTDLDVCIKHPSTLVTGVVESTENIYRYHMQLQQGASSPPGTRSPPQPQVQTPVAPSAGGKHSRSSSRSSEQSQSQSVPTATTTTTSPEAVLQSVTS
jgi:hypothetical protein